VGEHPVADGEGFADRGVTVIAEIILVGSDRCAGAVALDGGQKLGEPSGVTQRGVAAESAGGRDRVNGVP
jgi:hypothetical protein